MSKFPILIYFIANCLWKWHIPVVPSLLTWTNRILFGCFLAPETVIGSGCRLGYGGAGVTIHPRAIIGKNVIIDQGVTIGGRSNHYAVPVIEDGVYIGAGAKILGPIKIGRNAVIGANAVVLTDVPEGCRAVGVPARILPPKNL
jgi:serine O-acetyltransferase